MRSSASSSVSDPRHILVARLPAAIRSWGKGGRTGRWAAKTDELTLVKCTSRYKPSDE